MMDGRIGAIRRALEGSGLVTYADHVLCRQVRVGFYGPFRDAVGSGEGADRRQAHLPDGRGQQRTRRIREVALDLAEGADMVMVKPGLPYLDIVRRVHETASACRPSPTRCRASTR